MATLGSLAKLAVVLCACLPFVSSKHEKIQAVECPFPEGQGVLSEDECNKYTACEWTDGRCHMVEDYLGGYSVDGDPEDTGRGFKVSLTKMNDSITMFNGDVKHLICEVIYHEEYHVQIKIYDAESDRYEVPVPLNLPEIASETRLYNVSVAPKDDYFKFAIARISTGENVFRTFGPLTYEDQFIQIHTWLSSEYLYGFGENTHGSLKHRFEPRSSYPIFARDQIIGKPEDRLNEYGHHPYYMMMEDDEGNAHSVLLFNSNAMEYSTYLLDDGTPALTMRTIGGIIDLHFFLGPTPEDLNVQYTNMIGRPIFPPYWSLGFQLSRWGYNSTDGVREVRKRMATAGIPQDVQFLDIDYMDHKKDFTYDQDAYGDLPDLIKELHDDKLRVGLILDPAIVFDPDNYPPSARGKDADVFIKWADKSLVPEDQAPEYDDYVVGYVWPENKTVFPDFLNPKTMNWWDSEIKKFHETLDFDALWIDMNEPANFGTNLEKPWNWPDDEEPWSLKCPNNTLDLPPYPTMMIRVGDNQSKKISDHTICMSSNQTDSNNTYLHYDVHSLFGWGESVATFASMEDIFEGKRPFLLSRSTFPGSGHHAIHWLGDNSADWDMMRTSLIGMMEFNMFGIPMIGADICGFLGEPDMEMCARWMEVGAFYPFSRNHNNIGTAAQDPAVWPEVATISRDILLLRYQYLPFLYGLFHRAHMNGHSVVRPLFNVFPQDLYAREVDDQFFWGSMLMIAPVLTKGAESREVYFPEGNWYDLVSGELACKGPSNETVDAPLKTLPLYVRGGSILPWQEPAVTTSDCRKNPFGLTIALDANGTAMGEIFWDGGDEVHVMSQTYLNILSFENNELTTEHWYSEDPVEGLKMNKIVFYGYSEKPSEISVNGTALESDDWKYDEDLDVLDVSVEISMDEEFKLTITV